MGRQREIEQILKLCQGELRSYLIIFGGRQTGKTSLLYRIPHFLDEKYLVQRINFQSMTGASPEQAYGYIASRLGPLVGLEEPSNLSGLDSVQLSKFVLHIAGQIHQSRLVLLFDELGSLPTHTAEALANLLRSWFTERFDPGCRAFGRIMVVLAGGIELYNLAAVQVSPLRNISETLYLPDLTAADVRGLISGGLRHLGLPSDLPSQFGEAVFSLAGGHPYITQRIGAELEILIRTEFSSITKVANIGYTVMMNDDSLVKHLRDSLHELQLWEAIPLLLSGTVKYSRYDEEMALLELLGLATEQEGYWVVRNSLFERILHEWQDAKSNRQISQQLPKVFISYSHQDEDEKNALLSHLGVLQHTSLIEVWSDDRISAVVIGRVSFIRR
jgi:hypothetical protein